MASEDISSGSTHSVEVIGKAFVEQYYHILHQSPDLVCRFYHDSSMMGRPDSNGVMKSVTTTQDINEKIMSLDYHNFKSEIKTVDSQNSLDGGVVVLVTGSLLGQGKSSRKFTQSFFLAPQEKGYYVLNDVFRLLDETEVHEDGPALANGVSEASPEAPLIPKKEMSEIQNQHALDSANAPVEELNNDEQVTAASCAEESSVVGEVEPVQETIGVAPKELQPVVEPSNLVQEEPVKQTYASILKVMKNIMGDSPAGSHAPVRAARPNTERHSLAVSVSVPASETLAPPNNSSSDKEGADGRSIYIRSLPMNATVVHLEDEFKKFGPIKPGGIQVRSNKLQGFCYGFVEFENSSAVQDALEASSVIIGGRQCFVEEKRTTSTVRSGSGRGGRFTPGRGGFRNDGQRGRGNFGGRGYGRGEVGNARGWGTSGQGGDGLSGQIRMAMAE